MVLPSVTDGRGTAMTAFSTTLLPAVLAVISRPSRMGTPDATRVPSVRVKRATAILRSIIAEHRDPEDQGVDDEPPVVRLVVRPEAVHGAGEDQRR